MDKLSRRDFLKIGALGLAGMAFRPWLDRANLSRPWLGWNLLQEEWPDAEHLGRNCTGGIINMRAKPSSDSAIVGKLYEDTVVAWLREVVGEIPSGLILSRWVETPNGYLYAPSVQPVFNKPNQPVSSLPPSADGPGMWVEVTVPYVDIYLIQEKPAAPWLQAIPRPRLYYGQVMWIKDITTNSKGQVLYRVADRYGSYGDEFWAAAEAFKPITDQDLTPINPKAQDKKIKVDLNHQTLSCFEGQQEVYFCLISSGSKFDKDGVAVDKWATPVGPHPIHTKYVSVHMAGGGTGNGWDTPGIGWTNLFYEGAAVHSTFWHNSFGMAKSHGCVNASIEDAKWIFRWTTPDVGSEPGLVTVGMPGGTIVDVVENA